MKEDKFTDSFSCMVTGAQDERQSQVMRGSELFRDKIKVDSYEQKDFNGMSLRLGLFMTRGL